MKADPASFTFVVLMSLLGALAAFATDMALAATEPMARELSVTPGGIGLALSAFMISFALSPLAYGPLSDRFGRRPIALAACFIYMVGGIGCIFAHALPSLLFWRFVQGIGGGARPLALAIIGDHFKGAAAREKMSYVSALSLLAPLLAPTIGAALLGLGGWRLIYLFLTVTGAITLALIWLRLGESLPPEKRVALSPRALAAHYASVFRNRQSLVYTTVAIAMFGVIFGYVSGSPLVMIGAFGLTPAQYGLTFAVNSFGLLIGSLVNARLDGAGVAPASLLATGLTLVAASTLALLAITLLSPALARKPVPVSASARALHDGLRHGQYQCDPIGDRTASAYCGNRQRRGVSCQLAFGALAGFLVADFYDGRSALSTIATMVVFALAGLAAFLLRRAGQKSPAAFETPAALGDAERRRP